MARGRDKLGNDLANDLTPNPLLHTTMQNYAKHSKHMHVIIDNIRKREE